MADPTQPAPSGKIVFSAQIKYRNSQVFSVNADGSNLAQLTNSAGFNTDPAWSPDGSEIVFCSSRFGNWDICVMDADGDNIRQLTKKCRIGWNKTIDFHPSWSPDGKWIVFQSNRDTKKFHYGKTARYGGDIFQLYIMDRDGKNIRRLTNDPYKNDCWPSFSPDGKTIIFESCSMRRTSPDIDYAMEILEMIGADGTNRRIIAEDKTGVSFGGYSQPAWAPDGSKMAFVSASLDRQKAFSENLLTIGVNGNDFGPIRELPAKGASPCWSPDGNFIALESSFNPENRFAIYIVNSDGTGITPLVDIPYSSGRPHWV